MSSGDFPPTLSSVHPTFRETADRLKLIAFDFDGVFTHNTVYVFEDGCEQRGQGAVRELCDLVYSMRAGAGREPD